MYTLKKKIKINSTEKNVFVSNFPVPFIVENRKKRKTVEIVDE